MRPRVDTTKCAGIGLCEMTAPNVFEIGADGQAHVIASNPAAEDAPAVEEAITNCPTGALSLD